MDEGIGDKIQAMEENALQFRRKAEERLLGNDPEKALQDNEYLFYPTEESEEFE